MVVELLTKSVSLGRWVSMGIGWRQRSYIGTDSGSLGDGYGRVEGKCAGHYFPLVVDFCV